MIWLYALLLFGGAMGLIAWSIIESRRDVVLERVLFGIEGETQADEEDLSAGDYGLGRAARFRYGLAIFLRTWPGRGMLAVVAGAAGYLAAKAGGLEFWSAMSVAATSSLLGVLSG